MKSVGIICEYNPFHNGHLYHIKKVKELYPNYVIIAVINGNFTQRGDVSLIDKWKKTEVALNYVDLVVELPFVFGSQAADIFTKGSTDILKALKVDAFVFGSESADIDKLRKIVQIQKSTGYNIKIKQYLSEGLSYPTSLAKALKDLGITLENNPATESLPGYKPMRPMVFCGLYPVDTNKYPDLREALEKLKLNDAALEFEPETSEALGFGFRCGFLGLLHMEITLERLEREFDINHIATSPSVIYKITKTDNEIIYIDSPAKMPDRQKIKVIEEPYIKTNIYVPSNYIGSVMELCQNKRGTYISMEYITTSRVNIHYEIPLSEIVYNFFDKLKSSTKGYASFDYDLIGYKPSDLVKMDVLLNGEAVDALSVIVHKDFAYNRGKTIVYKLKDIIPRQLFEVPIQAVIGSKVIARTDIKAMRKNVLAKCYGGDITRKRKLLEKQKEGKKRMKMVGKVEVPSEAFLAVLNVDEQ